MWHPLGDSSPFIQDCACRSDRLPAFRLALRYELLLLSAAIDEERARRPKSERHWRQRLQSGCVRTHMSCGFVLSWDSRQLQDLFRRLGTPLRQRGTETMWFRRARAFGAGQALLLIFSGLGLMAAEGSCRRRLHRLWRTCHPRAFSGPVHTHMSYFLNTGWRQVMLSAYPRLIIPNETQNR